MQTVGVVITGFGAPMKHRTETPSHRCSTLISKPSSEHAGEVHDIRLEEQEVPCHVMPLHSQSETDTLYRGTLPPAAE